MTYTTFSTQRADYHQVLTHHGDISKGDFPVIGRALDKIVDFEMLKRKGHPTDEIIFDKCCIGKLDGIVLENYDAKDSPDLLENSVQYRKIMKNILETGTEIPLYFLDVLVRDDDKKMHYVVGAFGLSFLVTAASLTTYNGVNHLRAKPEEKKMSRRKFLKSCVLGGGYAMLGMYMLGGFLYWPMKLGFKSGKADKFSQWMTYAQNELFPTTTVNLRNAIWAEKIEKTVVPRLRRKLGRKPKIAIVSGVMHAGLQQYLQDRGKRKKVLERYGYELLRLIKKDQDKLNNILEVVRKNGVYYTELLKSDIF